MTIAATKHDFSNMSVTALREECVKLRRQLRETQNDFAALQRALVGNTGLSAIDEAHKLRKMHPL